MTAKPTVKFMRIACPANAVFCALACAIALHYDRPYLAVIDAFCAGINVEMTWVQWCVFKP
jgi:hypothetical protein